MYLVFFFEFNDLSFYLFFLNLFSCYLILILYHRNNMMQNCEFKNCITKLENILFHLKLIKASLRN